MAEQNETSFSAPQESVTPRNLELAIRNLSSMKASMEAIYEASRLPENQDFADRLLNRALQIYEIGEAMNASSPV